MRGNWRTNISSGSCSVHTEDMPRLANEVPVWRGRECLYNMPYLCVVGVNASRDEKNWRHLHC